MTYELAIIGGGPAGVAAGVYAARKRIKTVFIAETVGGQSTESQEVQNWIGTEKIGGAELGHALERHLRAYADGAVDIEIGDRVVSVAQEADRSFRVTTASGASYSARAVLVATGGKHRSLDIPGAREYENKGISYCASCDGPLFTGQDVVVVGGGNAGFEAAAQILAYAKSVTLVHRSAEFSKADKSTVDAVLAHPNMTALRNTEPIEIRGNGFVSSVIVKDRTTGETHELPAAGIFVEIGVKPATDFVRELVDLDQNSKVIVDSKTQRTSREGVWSAGDCTDALYHQNNIAAGDAIKALEDIYYWLRTK